jgi:hypothetical protein
MKKLALLSISLFVLAGCGPDEASLKQIAADTKRSADAAEKSAAALTEIKAALAALKTPDLSKIEASLGSLQTRKSPLALPHWRLHEDSAAKQCAEIGYKKSWHTYENVGVTWAVCYD